MIRATVIKKSNKKNFCIAAVTQSHWELIQLPSITSRSIVFRLHGLLLMQSFFPAFQQQDLN